MRIRLDEELPTYVALGDHHSWATTLGSIANSLLGRGQAGAAPDIIRERALPVLIRTGIMRDVALARRDMGRCPMALGRWKEAVEVFAVARDFFDGAASPREAVAVRVLASQALWQSNARPAALRELHAAPQRAEAESDPSLVVTVCGHLLPRLLADHRPAEARRVFADVTALLSSRGRFDAVDRLAPWDQRLATVPPSASANREARRKSRRRP
ncbi:MAG: hypothetical protein Q8S73_44685 [Deltaproteobacteria bacterium]|nr:hypothetical protein [Myxococcales bacterium]MDP3221264.1 hypothetical protein [Deltaproteobacteria bacterium]